MVIGSTDLTHYGERFHFAPAAGDEDPHEWMRRNDQRILDLVVRLEAERIVPDAAAHWNACGAGALAAAVFAEEVLEVKNEGARQGVVGSMVIQDRITELLDIKSIIQEIVNRAGWQSGNSLAIIISGTGERVAEAYDGSAAPQLHIEYQ